MKHLPLIFLFIFSPLHANTVYQCKDETGKVSFQDQPCEGETIKTTETKGGGNAGFRKEMIKALAKMSGKSEAQLQDPKVREAVEVYAATDAAKSYAFTKIYGVSAKYCGSSVQTALSKYKSKASEIIALGKYYYTNGIHLNIGSNKKNVSGAELTTGLNGMLAELDSEHKSSSSTKLERKCNSAYQSLTSLAQVYGN